MVALLLWHDKRRRFAKGEWNLAKPS
jgi:hypothetical protein